MQLASYGKKATLLFLYVFTIIFSYFELQWLGFLDIQKLLFCLIPIINQVGSFGTMTEIYSCTIFKTDAE